MPSSSSSSGPPEPSPGQPVPSRGTVSLSGLFRALESDDRFRRDTPLGGIVHGRKISFREVTPSDSLHLIIDGNRVSAHVDRVSPLNCDPDAPSQYSLPAIVAHNVGVVVAKVARRLRGGIGAHRCNLECDVVWVDDEPAAELGPDDQCAPPSGPTAGPRTVRTVEHDHPTGQGGLRTVIRFFDDHGQPAAEDVATCFVAVEYGSTGERVGSAQGPLRRSAAA